MSDKKTLIPLDSRLFSFNQSGSRVYALIGEVDRNFVHNVCLGIYEMGLDIYLGGEIVRSVLLGRDCSYSVIDLIATSTNSSPHDSLISLLRRRSSQQYNSSDAWIHLGMTVQKQEGWNIKDINCGSKFYANEISSSVNHTVFRLTPAIYERFKINPSPILLHLLGSTNDYRVL